jgi:hypothetical protein
MKKDSNTLLIFLVILSLTTFTRSLVYIIFHTNERRLSKTLLHFDKLLEVVLLIFGIIRIVLATIIINERGIHNDILTFVLIYLIFSSFQRFYYHYLLTQKPDSQMKKYLEKFQNLNSILILLSSLYIMKYVFFS